MRAQFVQCVVKLRAREVDRESEEQLERDVSGEVRVADVDELGTTNIRRTLNNIGRTHTHDGCTRDARAARGEPFIIPEGRRNAHRDGRHLHLVRDEPPELRAEVFAARPVADDLGPLRSSR